MSEGVVTEKRSSRRVSVILPTQAYDGDPGQKAPALAGHTENISSKGMRVRIEKTDRLQVDSAVYLRLNTLKSEGFINLQGRVRWIDDADDDSMLIGLELVGMNLSEWDRWMDLLSWHTE